MNLEYLLEDDLYEISEESVKGIIKKGYALLLDLLTRIFHKLEEIKRRETISNAVQTIYRIVNKVPLDERYNYIWHFADFESHYKKLDLKKNKDDVKCFNRHKLKGELSVLSCVLRIMINIITKFKTDGQLKALSNLYDSIKQKDWNSLNENYINTVISKLNDTLCSEIPPKKAELSLPDGTSNTMVRCIKLWFNCVSLLLRKTLRFYRSNKDQWRMTDAQKLVIKNINELQRDCHDMMTVLERTINFTIEYWQL